jgi:putative ABC transport system permease protein
MALGAKSGQILQMMALQSLVLIGAGLVCGLGAAFAAGRILSGFLVGITGADPLTFVAVTLLLAVVALAACYIPARRATRIDPVVALRVE